ncbi:MAG: ABC transporter substrate-binding protein [Spirochaetales bacterium]|nr:ABC transporter substrate-binding protein [Spirochaetales bacterium]
MKKPHSVTYARLVTAAVLGAVFLAACVRDKTEADAGSVFYRGRDLAGNEIVLLRRPQRIVSLAPSNTEIVFALGAGDSLVGASAYSDYPPGAARLPRVSDLTRANLERVAALAPDLVLAGNKIDSDTLSLLGRMRAAAAVTEGTDFASTYASILAVGAMTGKAAEAEALVKKMRADIQSIADRAEGAPTPLCYYIVSFGSGGDWTAGPGSFIDEMISLAGGQNAGASLGRPWGIFQLEKLVALDPAVIIAGTSSGPLDRLSGEPGYSSLSAVKQGRVAIVDDDLVTRPGPRLAQGLMEIARSVHPEIFGPLPRKPAQGSEP